LWAYPTGVGMDTEQWNSDCWTLREQGSHDASNCWPSRDIQRRKCDALNQC
jgi:hypothetical protein